MISRRQFLVCAGLLASPGLLAIDGEVPETSWNVRNFGAKGDGATLDTHAVQEAIDACGARGGGVVSFPTNGTYLIGTIFLRNHVTLEIEKAASILGSMDLAQYARNTGISPYYPEPLDLCLIYAKDATDIGIKGEGTIVGRKTDQYASLPNATAREAHQRPMLIRLENCSRIAVTGVSLERCGSWCIHLKHSTEIILESLRIDNDWQDGIDLEGCENTTISNCQLVCGDDCIALMTSSPGRAVRNVTVSNCMMRSRCSGIRFGPLSKGDFENIVVSNCIMYDCNLGGIKLGMFEGAEIRNCIFSDIVMDQVTAPISIFIATWPDIGSVDPSPRMMPVGKIHNLQFLGIRAITKVTAPDPRPDRDNVLFFQGHPESSIENITLTDIDMTFAGGGTAREGDRRDMIDMDQIGYLKGGYWTDDKNLWGVPPAYGLYARHVKGLSMTNVNVSVAQPDARSPIFCLDSQDISIFRYRAECAVGIPMVTARNCCDVVLSDLEPQTPTLLLRVEGEKSSGFEIMDSDNHRYPKLFECADGAKEGAVLSR